MALRLSLLVALALVACTHATAVAPSPGFVAVYRWRVREGCESDFLRAWEAETRAYRKRFGSLGTRLHRADDGTFVATAFWPDRDRWEQAHRAPLPLGWPEAVLDRCILEKVEELRLTPVRDLTSSP